MKKLVLSFAFAGILGATSAVAESDGWFIGGGLGWQGQSAELSTQITTPYEEGDLFNDPLIGATQSVSSLGILGGYKQFFTPEFGARYYLNIQFPTNALNSSVNADVIYNFAQTDKAEFGAFGGFWLGYSIYNLGFGEAKGVDLGVNVGLKAQITEKHGVELFGHFGFLKQKWEWSYDMGNREYGVASMEAKISQPYQIGLRYIYSF